VNFAALPARALHDRRYRSLEPFVRITDDELRPSQAALAKRTQERRPALLTLRVDDVDRDHVAKAAGRNAVSNNDRIANHGVVDPNLFIERVEPKIWIFLGERSTPEFFGFGIELRAEFADLRFCKPLHAHLLEHVLHFTRADAGNEGFLITDTTHATYQLP